MRITLPIFLFGGLLSPLLLAVLPILGPWQELMPESAPAKTIKFSGLEFSFRESLGTCKQEQEKVICALSPAFGPHGEMVFERVVIKSASSLPLIRLKRKGLWGARYKIMSGYKEVPYNTGLGNLLGQSAKVYHLDNIQWPVLLRAFDVVMNDKTCISISTKCGFEHGPLLENEVAAVLSSFKRTAQN